MKMRLICVYEEIRIWFLATGSLRPARRPVGWSRCAQLSVLQEEPLVGSYHRTRATTWFAFCLVSTGSTCLYAHTYLRARCTLVFMSAVKHVAMIYGVDRPTEAQASYTLANSEPFSHSADAAVIESSGVSTRQYQTLIWQGSAF
jgi:hypothetical protein